MAKNFFDHDNVFEAVYYTVVKPGSKKVKSELQDILGSSSKSLEPSRPKEERTSALEAEQRAHNPTPELQLKDLPPPAVMDIFMYYACGGGDHLSDRRFCAYIQGYQGLERITMRDIRFFYSVVEQSLGYDRTFDQAAETMRPHAEARFLEIEDEIRRDRH